MSNLIMLKAESEQLICSTEDQNSSIGSLKELSSSAFMSLKHKSGGAQERFSLDHLSSPRWKIYHMKLDLKGIPI